MKKYEEQIAAVESDSDEIRHPLTENDGKAVAAMREQVAPFKGKMSGPEARTPFDETMEQTPDAPHVSFEDGTVAGVAGVWCCPRTMRPATAILYLHGGAYVLGSAHAYRHFAGQIAWRVGAETFVADYRLAPENIFPAAMDDAKTAYRGLVEGGAKKIAIVGDSAGGGMTLALLAALQSDAQTNGDIKPKAAVAMSPWTDLALTGESMDTRAEDDPLLTREMLSKTAASYLNGHDPRDPLASPLYGSFDGLPPILLHVGMSEVLLDDARRYGEKARAAGADATVHVWEGMTHVFPASIGMLDAAEEALNLITKFLWDEFGKS